MSLSNEALRALKEHWAVTAIGAGELERADVLVNQRLVRQAVGNQISFSFVDTTEDEPFLERVALAFELAAIEGLEELSRPAGDNLALRDQAVAASFQTFNIRRLFPVPAETHDRLFFVLHLSAIAYCGDRWSDLRRWYREHEEVLIAPSVANTEWDRRLLYRLFDCWVRLFRKAGLGRPGSYSRDHRRLAKRPEGSRSPSAAKWFGGGRQGDGSATGGALQLGEGY